MELFILFPDGQVTCVEIIFNSVRHETIFRARDWMSDQGSADDNSKMGLKIACEGEQPITVAHNRVKGEFYGHGDQHLGSIKGGIS
jgi:hypothetical protein